MRRRRRAAARPRGRRGRAASSSWTAIATAAAEAGPAPGENSDSAMSSAAASAAISTTVGRSWTRRATSPSTPASRAGGGARDDERAPGQPRPGVAEPCGHGAPAVVEHEPAAGRVVGRGDDQRDAVVVLGQRDDALRGAAAGQQPQRARRAPRPPARGTARRPPRRSAPASGAVTEARLPAAPSSEASATGQAQPGRSQWVSVHTAWPRSPRRRRAGPRRGAPRPSRRRGPRSRPRVR